MADTLDVITLAEAKLALNIPVGNTTDDGLIGSYVTSVSRRMDQLCGPIVKRAVTESFSPGCGSSAVMLKYRPVASITSVTDSGTVLDPSSYYISPAGVVTKIAGAALSWWLPGFLTVSVAYVAGRFDDTASVEEPFRRAAAMLLAHLFRPEHGMGSTGFGGVEDFQGLPGYFLPNAVRGLLGDELQPSLGIA